MLRFLRVRNLAVIDAVEVEFDSGFNVLTGETGAGKSVLVEAVGLLLGGRASGDLVRTGEEAAVVEAIFERPEAFRTVADSGDGAADDELVVRREITAHGRSRAFVNGALATAGALKDLSAELIELHGQHEHHTLLDPAAHLGVLDTFGALDDLRGATASAFEQVRAAAADLERLRRTIADRDARLDIVTFQLHELDRAAPKPGEDEELAAARQVLASAERVERLCAESYATLYESDAAVLSGLSGVWRRVGELAALDPRFLPYLDARDGIKSQLEDLAGFLRHYADTIEASPARLQQFEERLALLERLKRKYGPSLPDVIARRDALRQEIADLTGGDERLAELERRYTAAREAYVGSAGALSAERKRAAGEFARRLEAALAELAMASTAFDVRFADPLPEAAWTPAGFDAAEFFVSPNPGEELRPLARIVSGGELSRIMLAIKTLTAARRRGFSDDVSRRPSAAAPGLIFDEVDAGIGGRVADVVGRKLRALGSAFQVLCITHLPQIAAYADTHFHVEKRVDGGRTRTLVSRLDQAGRVDEIARMLGGEAITGALRASAREMLEERAPANRRSDASPAAPAGQGRGESERAKAKPLKGRRGA